MTNKTNYVVLILIFVSIGFIACENSVEPVDVEEAAVVVEDGKNHYDADDYSWDESDEVNIVLADNSIVISGNGASAEGNIVTVTAAGTYNIDGSLSDGQIIINSKDDEIVRLVLNGININCSYGPSIYILNADRAMLVLAENTNNFLSDGSTYSISDLGEDEPNAALFSMADLTINGNGTLTISGNYNDGIVSKDGLIISSGTININAVDDGIRGKDYLVIYDGILTLDVEGVGLKSDNSDDASKGYITIKNGTININSGGIAIDAKKDVEIFDGNFNILSNGKGINGKIGISIDDGTFIIITDGDGIHSSSLLTIKDGKFTICSGNDAIHADFDIIINNGDINITKSYEGIESAEGDITINGGNIHLVSSDDGINIAATGNHYLNINDGYIVVNAGGDGVDVNSSVIMTGGDLIVSGSTENSNSALDYDGSFQINGGFLVATGTSKMAEAPGNSSKQNSLLINFSSTESSGHIIHIENENGEEVLTISPKKSYQSIAFSSSALLTGSGYVIYLGGTSTGTVVDGIYKNGTYSSGTKYKSFTISSTVTIIN